MWRFEPISGRWRPWGALSGSAWLAAIFLSACAGVNPDRAQDQRLLQNKETVLAFYEAALNRKDFTEASQYLGSQYIQHNPGAKDGPSGLHDFLEFLKSRYPQSHSDIKSVFADGDRVILHVHAVREPGTRGFAIVDIFRLQDGKIVEHWDVIQAIPENPANGNGMF